jgi:hypothetical protein
VALDPFKTAIIFIGSETFPKSSFEQSSAFTAAKKRIHDFFKDVLKLDELNFLDLFGKESGADDQDSSISDFIKLMVAKGVEDLFIYYVGHGSFNPTDNSYYLALKNTREENPGVSSMTINILGRTVSLNANGIRTFLILDCCFSGAAGMAFMSDQYPGPAIQLREAFPSKGIAMLCASSKNSPAMIVRNRDITMFTEGLELALKSGDPKISEKFLSLRQIQQLTFSYIKQCNPGEAIRPEVISPNQAHGDIADMELFENRAYQDARYDISAKRNNIINEMVSNNFINLGNLIIDFVKEYIEDQDLLMDAIIFGSECNELNEAKGKILTSEYSERKKTLYRDIMKMVTNIFDHAKENIG